MAKEPRCFNYSEVFGRARSWESQNLLKVLMLLAFALGSDKAPFTNAYASMESVGLQYGSDEFVEGPVHPDGRYASPKSGAIYAPDGFYDAPSGSWYPASGVGSYGPQSSSGNYHNVNHPSHMAQQASSHEHYGMSPHMEAPHMSTTPQPLPPMSSFRGSSTNGPPTSVGPAPTNPALYNPSLAHHAPSHNLQNDTLVGKALQTVSKFNFGILARHSILSFVIIDVP